MNVDYAVSWFTSSGEHRDKADNEGHMIGILPAGVGEHGAQDRAVILDAEDRFRVVDLYRVNFLGSWKGWGRITSISGTVRKATWV